VKEQLKLLGVSLRKKMKRKTIRVNRNKVKYNLVRSGVHKKVHKFFLQNQSTFNSVLRVLNNEPDLPNFKGSTLHPLLREVGFVYERKGNRVIITEKEYIVSWCSKFLTKIKFRKEQNITHEHYVHRQTVSQYRTLKWKDKTVKTRRQALLARLSTGLVTWGFVLNAELIFLWVKDKNQPADVHNEMDGKCY
jgi:hypothetical protein